MGLPAGSLAIVFDLEAVFERLPATARAQLAWARKPIDLAIERLMTESLDERLIEEASAVAWRPLAMVGAELWKICWNERDQLAAAVMNDLQKEEGLLREHLVEANAVDTLEWVFGLLRTFVTFTLSNSEPPRSRTDDELEQLGAEPLIKNFGRASVCLLAASELARRRANSERARALIDVAFLELLAFKKLARALGFWLSPFPNQTLEERGARMGRYAESIRRCFTDDDWDLIERSRFESLR